MNVLLEKVNGVIYPQITQLINLYSVQYINTGDRVKDGIIIVLLNGVISLILSALYNVISIIYKKHYMRQMGDQMMNIDEIMAEYPLDKVIQYKHEMKIYSECGGVNNNTLCFTPSTQYSLSSRLYLDCDNVLMWAKEQHKLSDLYSTTNTKINYYFKLNKNDMNHSLQVEHGSLSNVFVPIKKYYNIHKNTFEYIFLVGTTIYSQSSNELDKLCHEIYVFYKELKMSLVQSKNNIIYEINSNLELVNKGKISENIVFDKIHFDEKPHILEWLDKFQQKTMYPKSLCMTNKLGILLYGPAGTGKTGCISAIANKLNRNILIINSLNLFGEDGKSKFEQLLKEHEKTCVIVLDEFDYILHNNKPMDQTPEINYGEMLLFSEGEERKNILEMMKSNKKDKSTGIIDTPFILKLLDGIGNDEDRIIIATTNHPEKINKLFLRPGRFDVKLKLGFCSLDMFINIVNCMYPEVHAMLDDDKSETLERKIRKLLKRNITPLVLINTMVVSKSFDDLLHSLDLLPHEDDYRGSV
jgi:DNA replication protein DnaC